MSSSRKKNSNFSISVLVFLSVFVSVQNKLVYLCDGRIVLLVTFLDL